MPLNANEAMSMFARKVETILEIADGLRLGLQLLQGQNQRIAQLEQFIQANKLQVPPPPGQPGMSPPEGAAIPGNVTPLPTPPQG